MKKVYLDNAATTPVHPEVLEVITHELQDNFGNPSSLHQFGRSAKAKLEGTRKLIASYFNTAPSTVLFTSGGTEANNFILYNAVVNLEVKRIISSAIEHHAVLHTLAHLATVYKIELVYVALDSNGSIDLNHLEELLKDGPKTLLSLMHINNEIGNILDIQRVAQLSQQYEAYFHSDTVQTIGHYPLDLVKTPVDFITASAHKFHGPKGVGFAIVKKGIPVKSLLFGGAQEKGVRAGTENVPYIVGMGKALSLSMERLETDQMRLSKLKLSFMEGLKELDREICFNGCSGDVLQSTYTLLNVRFSRPIPMMLFQLDLKGIAASGGSACQSGSDKGSHVLREILNEEEEKMTSVRFSFGHDTSQEEIAYTLEVIQSLI
ncbi:cysteine desulfurase [Flavobacteriaceae bacterium F08102]|nr:cysteine desulfurase [Flavobacteriaceae bacterium F08102]